MNSDTIPVNNQLHITNSTKSEIKREYDEVTGEMPNSATGKRQCLASPDLSAHLDTNLNTPLDCGSDVHKRQTVASLHSSRPHRLYLYPEQTTNSHASTWSDEELDCLWIGVRRHGNGNWDAILGDPLSRSLAWKTPRDLALQWEEEQFRLLHNITVSHTPLPRMLCPNPSEGSFMSLLRQVEMESAIKARGIANSPSLIGRANKDSE